VEFNLSFSFGKKKDRRNVKVLPPPSGASARQTGGSGLEKLGSMFNDSGLVNDLIAPRGRDMGRRDPDIAFSLHVWTRVAVQKIAKMVAAHRIIIETVDPEQRDNPKFKKPIKAARKVLYNPNIMDGYQDYIAASVQDLMLNYAGTSEIGHWNMTGEPSELWSVPVNTIRVNKKGGKINPEKAFTEMRGGSAGPTLSVKELLYFRYLPRAAAFIPESVIATMNKYLQQDGYALKFNLDSLQNGNMVRQIIALGGGDEAGGAAEPVDPEDVAKAQQEWDEKHKGGRTNRRVTFVAGNKITPVPLDNTKEDMQWDAMQKMVVRVVAALYDMPLIYFSYPDDTKFSNAEFEEKRFAQHTILPVTVALCDKYNQFFIPQFGLDPDEEVHCVPNPKLLAITELDLAREKHDIQTGVTTVNEVRERRGDKPNVWGSKYRVSNDGKEFVRLPDEESIKRDEEAAANPEMTPVAQPPEATPPGAGGKPPPKPGKPTAQAAGQPKPATTPTTPKPGGKKSISRFRDRRQRAMRTFRRGVARVVDRTRIGLLVAIERAVSRMAHAIKQVPEADIDALRELLEAEPVPLTAADMLKGIEFVDSIEAEALNEEVRQVLRDGIRSGFLVGIEEGEILLGELVGEFGAVPEDIINSLSADFIEVSDKLQFAVNRTAKDIVMEGVRAGKNSGQIAAELRQGIMGSVREDGRIVFHDGTGAKRAYSMTPQNWSEVTAQTNITHAANRGRQESWKRAGVRSKQWFDMGDARVRQTHRENTAQGPIPIDEPFSNGNMHPGEDPGCRCEMEIPDSEMVRLGA
jgi:hypothetical protein